MDQDDDHPAASPLLPSGSLAESSRSHEMQDVDDPMATPNGNQVLQTPMGTAIGTWAKAVGRETTCECGDKDDDESMLGCSGELSLRPRSALLLADASFSSACLGWKHGPSLCPPPVQRAHTRRSRLLRVSQRAQMPRLLG